MDILSVYLLVIGFFIGVVFGMFLLICISIMFVNKFDKDDIYFEEDE